MLFLGKIEIATIKVNFTHKWLNLQIFLFTTYKDNCILYIYCELFTP